MKNYLFGFIFKRLLLFAAVFVFMVWVQPMVLVSPSHPEFIEEEASQTADPEIRAKIYGVTFPIAELGGCQNYYDCRNYCEDPVNASTCVDFGKKKGFYKDEEEMPKKEKVLERAKTELGCDSYGSCQSLCQIPTNFEKCDSFAKKEGIGGGHVEDPKNKVILEKAKAILGCDSYSTCASYCSDDANRGKCTEFAKETGLKGGEQRVGPGGCNSEDTCKIFCSDPNNFQVCRGFASSGKQEFTGPGGCNSEDSCRSYCERNPQDCGPSRGGGPVPVPIKYDPQEMCNRTPACSWKDNTCQCGQYNDEENKRKRDEYGKICRENPQRCTPGGIGGSESRDDRAAFEKYCRDNPEKCRPAYYDVMGGRNYDPAQECTKYAGCAWTNGSCQCGTRYENYSPAPGTDPGSSGAPAGSSGNTTSGSGYGSREDQERGCRSGGGSCDWSNGMCNCRGYSSTGTTSTGGTSGNTGITSGGSTGSYTGTMDPAEGCRRAGGSWTGSYCQMPNTSSGGSYSGSGGSTSGSSGSSGGSAPVPATEQQSQPIPAPAPDQQSQPAPAAPVTEPAPAPAVQGISAVRNILDRVLDLLR